MKTKMKGLLAIGIIYFIIGCSKDETPPDTILAPDTTIYEGTWRGTFSGDSSGTWIYIVTGKGTLTGSATVANGDMHTKSGTVSASGAVNVSISNGGSNTGQFNAEAGTYTGTWKNNDPNNPLSGTSMGSKD
jgi:hypothetical protein